MVVLFADEGVSGFYDTSAQHDQLAIRPRELQDGATPSGSSSASDVLIRMGQLHQRRTMIERAEGMLRSMRDFMEDQPLGFGRYLSAACRLLGTLREIAIAAPDGAPGSATSRKSVYRRFEPNAVIGLVSEEAQTMMPWLADRPIRNNQATAYLCEQFVCLPPVNVARRSVHAARNGNRDVLAGLLGGGGVSERLRTGFSSGRYLEWRLVRRRPYFNGLTPGGVPVMMMSPGSSVITCEMNEMSESTLQIILLVDEFCRISPLTSQLIFSLAGSSLVRSTVRSARTCRIPWRGRTGRLALAGHGRRHRCRRCSRVRGRGSIRRRRTGHACRSRRPVPPRGAFHGQGSRF